MHYLHALPAAAAPRTTCCRSPHHLLLMLPAPLVAAAPNTCCSDRSPHHLLLLLPEPPAVAAPRTTCCCCEAASEAGKISAVTKAADNIAKAVHASATKIRSLQAIQESLQQLYDKVQRAQEELGDASQTRNKMLTDAGKEPDCEPMQVVDLALTATLVEAGHAIGLENDIGRYVTTTRQCTVWVLRPQRRGLCSSHLAAQENRTKIVLYLHRLGSIIYL